MYSQNLISAYFRHRLLLHFCVCIVLLIDLQGYVSAQFRPMSPIMASESCVQMYSVPKHTVMCDPSPQVTEHINELTSRVEVQAVTLTDLKETVQSMDPDTPRPIPEEVVARLDAVDLLRERTSAHTEILTRLDGDIEDMRTRLVEAMATDKQQVLHMIQQQTQLIRLTQEQSNITLHEDYVAKLDEVQSLLGAKMEELERDVQEQLTQTHQTVQNVILETQETMQIFMNELRGFLDEKLLLIDEQQNRTYAHLQQHASQMSDTAAQVQDLHNRQADVNATQHIEIDKLRYITQIVESLQEYRLSDANVTVQLEAEQLEAREHASALEHKHDQLKTELQQCVNSTTELWSVVNDLSERLHRQQHVLPKTIRAHDCDDILKFYQPISGVYTVTTHAIDQSFTVYCDLSSSLDGTLSGWTVIQRRDSGSVDFYRTWEEYKVGFGDIEQEYWLGFDKLRAMLGARKYQLRIDVLDWNNNWRYAQYDHFYISNEDELYSLEVSGYSGDAGDSLSYHNGVPFSTYDRSHDESGGVCPELCHGGWWYKNCYHSNLNGRYYEGGHYSAQVWGDGVVWRHVYDTNMYSLKATIMKIRPQPI